MEWSSSYVFLLPSNELLRIHCIHIALYMCMASHECGMWTMFACVCIYVRVHIDVYMCMNSHEFGIWTMFACVCIYVRVITLNGNV